MVMQDLEQSIRERAYHLWIEGGCQDGQADAHWLAAQREVLGTFLGSIGRVTLSEQHPAETSEKPKKAARKKQRAA
jgi:hypothetical protein